MIVPESNVPQSGFLAQRLAHPRFPQPPDPSVKVWRYMNLPKLISLIQSNALYLARLDQLADPYEGSTTHRTAAGIDAFLKTLGSDRGYQDMANVYEKNRESMFVSCWHANEHESEAMWRLYGGGASGIAVQSTYSRLIDSVETQYDVYVGLVQYIDYNTASFPSANVFYPVMHKRASFAHEREVRLVRHWTPNPEHDERTLSLSMPWNVEAFCDHIYVDPYAPEYYFEAVKAVVETMAPALLSRLEWSQMKTAPFF